VDEPAPIVAFVYDRPAHTRRMFASLLANPEAERSDLYVFCDGPRDQAAEAAVGEVRGFVRGLSGFRSMTIVERETNLGLADSIIEGVTTVCAKHGRVVVLEDDLIVSPHFLRFMNDTLDLYEDEPAVMHVSACAYPVEPSTLDDTYFLRVPLCWGWATWERAWREYRRDLGLMREFDGHMRREFDFDGTYNYWEQLVLNKEGRIKTWFVFWYATLFLRGGLALFPRQPLARNMGFDGTGVHCHPTHRYDVDLSPDAIPVAPIPVAESAGMFESHRRFFRSVSPGPAGRARHRAARMLVSTRRART